MLRWRKIRHLSMHIQKSVQLLFIHPTAGVLLFRPDLCYVKDSNVLTKTTGRLPQILLSPMRAVSTSSSQFPLENTPIDREFFRLHQLL